LSRKHYSDYYKDRIAQLEREMQIVSSAAREAERHGLECLSLLKDEKRRRQAAEAELERQRSINAELSAKSYLWENHGRDMYAELEKMKNLSNAYATAQQRIKELEKKLNIRKGTENPYGLNTPSSRQVNKANSTPENRAKRGGAKVGHQGHGRKDFVAGDADKVKTNTAPPLEPC